MNVFIGIGSNLGHRFGIVRKSIDFLSQNVLTDMRTSVILENPALLPEKAPNNWNLPFFNLVVSGSTSHPIDSVLETLKKFEKMAGRDTETPRWSPRIIDLDILAYGDQIFKAPSIPHPELLNRRFLMHLMASLDPHWRYPVANSPYFRLTLTEILHRHLQFHMAGSKCFMPFPQMVGIVNVTPDSFSDGGKYLDPLRAIEKIEELIAEGAAVIDIGAESTHPNSPPISAEEEWRRLEPVLNLLKERFQSLLTKPLFSLDSRKPEVIRKALERYPFNWINDVGGGENEDLLHLIAETECRIVLTHSFEVPPKVSSAPLYKPMEYIKNWAEQKLDQLNRMGISKERVIFDPGIGFRKPYFESISLMRDIGILKELGCDVIVGHSRKGFLKVISTESDRDLETLGISHTLYKKGVDYLRVHNVQAHQRSLTSSALVEGINFV